LAQALNRELAAAVGDQNLWGRRAWLRCPFPRTKDPTMDPHPASRIADAFVDLVDPRVARTRRHQLLDILTITLCGVLCGAENWVEIADWASTPASGWVIERTLARLNRYRRLTIRYELLVDLHQAFLTLGCALICFTHLPSQEGL